MKTLKTALTAAAILSLAAAPSLHSQSAPNAFAPLAYAPLGNYGQALVDMEMAKHSELKLITLHVTPAGVPADSDKDRCILCSSIGRIGKHDNDEDIGIFRANKEKTELEKDLAPGAPSYGPTAPPKYEVMTPLLDKAGETIGLAVIVFGYKAGDDVKKFDRIAHDIRDELRERIAAKDDLLKPAS
jgi:hypothetical protein